MLNCCESFLEWIILTYPTHEFRHSQMVIMTYTERVKGIEPSSIPWEGIILPVNYTRLVYLKELSNYTK